MDGLEDYFIYPGRLNKQEDLKKEKIQRVLKICKENDCVLDYSCEQVIGVNNCFDKKIVEQIVDIYKKNSEYEITIYNQTDHDKLVGHWEFN